MFHYAATYILHSPKQKGIETSSQVADQRANKGKMSVFHKGTNNQEPKQRTIGSPQKGIHLDFSQEGLKHFQPCVVSKGGPTYRAVT